MQTPPPKTRCDRCGKVTPDSQLLAYRGMCPHCAEQQHSASAERLRHIERAETLVLTPGETHLFFSWEKDPADTFRWKRLPIRDPELARLLASYKAIKRVLQFAGRIGDALPNSRHLTTSAEVIGAAGARNSAQHLHALARAVHENSACKPLDQGTVLLVDNAVREHLTGRQAIRTPCEALRDSTEDPLGVALMAFRRHPQAWRLIEHAANRAGFPAHLRHVLGRRHGRAPPWPALGVLRRLRPATATLVECAFRSFDHRLPIHSIAIGLQDLLISESDHSRQAEWDRLLLECQARDVALAALSAHFEGRCKSQWVDAFRLYLNELHCEDLEERSGAELAAAVTAEIRAAREGRD